MNSLIRKAQMADYAGICAVIEEVDQLHREHFPGRFCKAPDGVARSEEYISALIEEPNACLLVAELEGEINGTC